MSSCLHFHAFKTLLIGVGTPGLLLLQVLKYLPGKFSEVSDISLKISETQPRVRSSGWVRVGPVDVTVSVSTDLESISGTRLKETYQSASVNGLEVSLESLAGRFSRELLVTYLDHELLIARDCYGSPEILRRKSSLLTQEVSVKVTEEREGRTRARATRAPRELPHDSSDPG